MPTPGEAIAQRAGEYERRTPPRGAPQHHRREAANRAASRRTEHRMALSDVANNLDTEVPWRTCATCHALASMNDDEAGVLRGLLANRNVKFSELATALEDDPDSPTIERQALSRHARGQCSARERLR